MSIFLDENEKIIKKEFEKIVTPETDLKGNISAYLSDEKTYKALRIRPMALACAMIFIFATVAFAANSDRIIKIINELSPSFDSISSEVAAVSNQDNGIILTIESVAKSNNSVKFLYSLLDLQGDRLDETTSLMDYYSVDGANHYSSKSKGFYVQEENKFYNIVEASTNDALNENEIVVRLSKIFYNEQNYENIVPKIDLAALKEQNYFILDDDEVMSASSDIFQNGYEYKTLSIDENSCNFEGIDSLSISNIGFIDDKLHIQVKHSVEYGSAHASYGLKLIDEAGNSPEKSEYRFAANDNGNIGSMNSYSEKGISAYFNEYVFDLKGYDINDLTLYFNITTRDIIEGQWSVQVETEELENITVNLEDVSVNGIIFSELSVNPLSLTISGHIEEGVSTQKLNDEITITIQYENNSLVELNRRSWMVNEEECYFMFNCKEPIDMLGISCIYINDAVIDLSK